MKKTSVAFLLVFVSLSFVLSNRVRAIIAHDSDFVTDVANRPAQPRVRPCVREDLRIKEGETDAAMGGVRETPYIFTNISSSACALDGYPALELLNHKGVVVRRATKQESDEVKPSATLEPGKTAWFNLNYNSGGAGHMGRPCPSYPTLKIVAPGTTRPFVVRSSVQSCPHTDFVVSSVSSGMPQ
ncbi:MAG TPA: DUF4232 domain-containing protein [Pyrinomonadaceae bacterium]|nr:DUF4232 domain-containing protein [Pyrinomonadaceae bacterium]